MDYIDSRLEDQVRELRELTVRLREVNSDWVAMADQVCESITGVVALQCAAVDERLARVEEMLARLSA